MWSCPALRGLAQTVNPKRAQPSDATELRSCGETEGARRLGGRLVVMASRWDWQGLARIMTLLLCGACGGEEASHHANGGASGTGATTSGGMGTSGTTTGGQHTGGVNGAGGPSGGGSSTAGSSASGSSNVGGSGGGASTVEGPGTVTDAWSSYCVATFTSDYEVVDSFDEPLFTARAGEQYLMTSYPSTFGGPNSAGLLYLTERGPFEFEVDSGSEPAPFTSNCPKSTAKKFYAVFDDVSLYSDSTLTSKLCDLTAGAALPLDGGYGFSLSSLTNGEAIYSVQLGPYSAQCGAAERGSIAVSSVQVLNQSTYLVPIRAILGPS
jgi:hypothetical protein